MNGLMMKLGIMPGNGPAIALLLLALAFALAEARRSSVANILLMFAAGGVGFQLARVMA